MILNGIQHVIDDENKTISLTRGEKSEIYKYNNDNSIKEVIFNGKNVILSFSDNHDFKNFETAKKAINDKL